MEQSKLKSSSRVVLLIFTFISLIFLVSATDPLFGTFKKGENITLIQTCSNCTYNNITLIQYPNSSEVITDQAMTKSGNVYSYLLISNYTQTSGRYLVNGIGDLNGVETVWAYDFVINPQGIPASDQRSSAISNAIIFLFIIGIVLFIAFLFVRERRPIKWTLFLISMMFLLQAVNLLFLNLQDQVVNPNIENYFSFLTASSFYLFWFAFGVLAIIWFLTFFQTLLFKKQQAKLEAYA